MGSHGLSTDPRGDHDRLRNWLATLPAGCEVSEAADLLGWAASLIAQVIGTSQPAALPAPIDGPDLPPPPDELLEPDLLGPLWETIMAGEERRTKGAHFTPRHVAERITELAFEALDEPIEVPLIWDPTCGGGVFLLAAARRIERLGYARADIVARCHGTDIDPLAARITDAALELWSGCAARPTVEVGDVLGEVGVGPGQVDLVLGNPPFLGQLTTDTTRGETRRATLVDRYGEAARGYVDDAPLVALEAVGRLRTGGVAALVLPQSVLGAVDSTPVRRALLDDASMPVVWIDDASSFDAAVDVMAPIFRRVAGAKTDVVTGERRSAIAQPSADSWSPVLAAAQGIPEVRRPIATAPTIRDLAEATAGFRQHFYGLAGAVREGAEGEAGKAKLVTSGAIEPLWCRWGERPVKFAGEVWDRPIVELDRIEDEAVAAWFAARRIPKLLVAAQTRVPEVVVDAEGALLPSVPVVSVEPHDPDDVWRLAALLCAPTTAASLATSTAGTGLSATALRLRADDVLSVPLPSDETAWNDGAQLARAVHAAAAEGDLERHHAGLVELARTMAEAEGQGAPESLVEWWCDRVGFLRARARI